MLSANWLILTAGMLGCQQLEGSLEQVPAPRNLVGFSDGRSAIREEAEITDPTPALYHLALFLPKGLRHRYKPTILELSQAPSWVRDLYFGRRLIQDTGQSFRGNQKLVRRKYAFDLEGRILFFKIQIFGESVETGSITISKEYGERDGQSIVHYGRGLIISYVLRSRNILGFNSTSIRDFTDIPAPTMIVSAYGYRGFFEVTIPTPKAKSISEIRVALEKLLIDKYQSIELENSERLFEPLEISYPPNLASQLKGFFQASK